jgi:putative hemolysin
MKLMRLSLLLTIRWLLIRFPLSCLLLTACSEPLTSLADTQQGITMANPASLACAKSGGTLSIQRDSMGAEFGLCSWPSGAQCEEWRYFRGECAAKKPDDLAK